MVGDEKQQKEVVQLEDKIGVKDKRRTEWSNAVKLI